MKTSNFSFSAWEDPPKYPGPELNLLLLPVPPDTYHPGHLSWGKSVKRGQAIQRARGAKRAAANLAFFLSTVLPLLEDKLNPAAWAELGYGLNRPDFLRRGGFVHYVLGDRASWIHPQLEPDKIREALAMGATPEENPALG